MNFFKKAVLAPFVVLAIAASAQAVANPINYSITLEAFVPTDEFYVLPVEGNWIGQPQRLNYNPTTKNLSQLTKAFDTLSTAGAIHASLGAEAMLASQSNLIPLTVKFNDITVTTTPIEVVSGTRGAQPGVANLEIIPTRPGSGNYVPGTYAGNVQLTFDAVAGPVIP